MLLISITSASCTPSQPSPPSLPNTTQVIGMLLWLAVPVIPGSHHLTPHLFPTDFARYFTFSKEDSAKIHCCSHLQACYTIPVSSFAGPLALLSLHLHRSPPAHLLPDPEFLLVLFPLPLWMFPSFCLTPESQTPNYSHCAPCL